MYMSPVVLEVIWRITEIFFIFSLVLLVFLFVVKKILENKKKFIQEKQLQYMYHDINQPVDISNDVELIAYSQVVGMRLLSTTEHEKRNSIKEHIKALSLYDRLFELYQNTGMYRTKLYVFSSLVLLSDTKGRTLFFSVINNAHKRKEMPEFITLALFGLSLSTETKEHLAELYEILESIDKEEYPSQKFSEFFLIQAYLSLDKKEILNFFKTFEPQKLTSVCYALVYALQQLPGSLEMYHMLLAFYKRYKDDPLLLVAILRVQYYWKIKDESLILAYHQHNQDLVRIVCAKTGLDILERENYMFLSHYLCDANVYVRKNFLISAAEKQISKQTLIAWVKEYYPDCLNHPVFEKSLSIYEKGVS